MNKIMEVLQEKGIKPTWLVEKLVVSYSLYNPFFQIKKHPSLVILIENTKIIRGKLKYLILE